MTKNQPLQIRRIFRDSLKLYFAPLTGAESLRNPFIPNLWHIRASYYEETESLVEQLTQVGIDRIAVVHQ